MNDEAALRRYAAVRVIEAEARQGRRFSRVLHDDFQQLIVAAKMAVELAVTTAGEDEKPALSRAAEHLGEALRVSRLLTAGLSPPVGFDEGFSRPLEWLAHHVQSGFGLTVELHAEPGAEPRAKVMKAFLLRGLWELLTSLARRQPTRRVALHVNRSGAFVVGELVGEGVAAAAQAVVKADTDASGLGGIVQLAEMLGGKVEFTAASGSATAVRFVIPQDVDGES